MACSRNCCFCSQFLNKMKQKCSFRWQFPVLSTSIHQPLHFVVSSHIRSHPFAATAFSVLSADNYLHFFNKKETIKLKQWWKFTWHFWFCVSSASLATEHCGSTGFLFFFPIFLIEHITFIYLFLVGRFLRCNSFYYPILCNSLWFDRKHKKLRADFFLFRILFIPVSEVASCFFALFFNAIFCWEENQVSRKNVLVKLPF